MTGKPDTEGATLAAEDIAKVMTGDLPKDHPLAHMDQEELDKVSALFGTLDEPIQFTPPPPPEVPDVFKPGLVITGDSKGVDIVIRSVGKHCMGVEMKVGRKSTLKWALGHTVSLGGHGFRVMRADKREAVMEYLGYQAPAEGSEHAQEA